MKKLVLFTLATLTTMFMVSCGGGDLNGQETISIGTALGYYFGQASYLIPLVIFTLIGGYLVYRGVNSYRTTGDWGANEIISIGVGVLIFLAALLWAPAEAAANTTVEMFNRTGEVIR